MYDNMSAHVWEYEGTCMRKWVCEYKNDMITHKYINVVQFLSNCWRSLTKFQTFIITCCKFEALCFDLGILLGRVLHRIKSRWNFPSHYKLRKFLRIFLQIIIPSMCRIKSLSLYSMATQFIMNVCSSLKAA